MCWPSSSGGFPTIFTPPPRGGRLPQGGPGRAGRAVSPKEQAAFLAEVGVARPARDRLVRGAFQAMDFVCFMTVGQEEVRAWNVRRGTIALHAAGKVHSDMEKGFIRAEVIPCEDFFRYGSMAKMKNEGNMAPVG